MKALRLFLFVVFSFLAQSAYAHEPLWGETPQTFSFGLIHPETRFHFENNSRLFQGSRRVPNVSAERHSRFETQLSVQYAPRTTLNVKLEIPMVHMAFQERGGERLGRSSFTGLGDMVVSAKSRFAQSFGEDWKVLHSYIVGLQLPTGEHRLRRPNGAQRLPSEQPGSGKFGVHLGYAFAWERLHDTTWASAMYQRDLGGGDRRGDRLEAQVSYGYWVRRAYRPQDLGVLLAVGPLLEWHDKDRVSAADPNSGLTRVGFQMSLIATKGVVQFRAGALIPLSQHYNGTQLGTDVQVRAGLEAFF